MEHITRHNIREKVAFRHATLDDLDELMALYRRYFEEADWKNFVAFDLMRARNSLRNRLTQPDYRHILALIGGRIVGFASWWLNRLFTVRPIAVMMEVYVEPAHRRGAVGRFLVKLMLWAARDEDACVFHVATAASGLEETRSFLNLLTKEGFEPFGQAMRKALT